MSLTLRFLGTSGSRPTVERNVSSIALVREGETLLIDCGEGTQRQMMRYGVSFTLSDILFTHLHADHILGLLGLLRTMRLGGRTEPMRLWGPPGLAKFVQRAEALNGERWGFPVESTELAPWTPVQRSGYKIVPYPADHHGAKAFGYSFVEEIRLGRFHPDMARGYGIPEGPLWGRLHRGESVTLDDGRTIDASILVGPSRPGRHVVITGDTRPTESTVTAALGADLLVHESTFGDDEAARAIETGHSTAREAATVALRAVVRRLILTHFSARYARESAELDAQAREIFPATSCARDGLEVDVPFVEETQVNPTASPPPAPASTAGTVSTT